MKNLFFTLLLLLVGISAFGAETQPKKYAVLIGVDDYAQLADLRFTKNDILALRDQLYKAGFEKDNVYCLTCGGETRYLPTKDNIEFVVTNVLESAKEEDLVILAMSGHGIEADQPRFCPMDTKEKELLITTVPISDVYDALERCKAKFKLMLVDACRENPFVSKSVDQAKPLQTFYDPPKGIVLFQSCAKGELSYEDGEIKQGFFTHYLVEGLEGKAKDKNGNVTLFSLASYVTDKTQRRALEQFQAKQRPYLKGETADFVLFGDEEPIQLIQVDAPRKEMIEALKMESYATYALKNKKEGYEKDITKTRELLNNSKLPQDFRELSLQIFDGLLKENPGMEFVEKFQKREELLKKKYGINYMEEMMKAAEELQK